LHQGNLVFDFKLFAENIDTYYYLKYKKIPGIIETKAKKINLSPTKKPIDKSYLKDKLVDKVMPDKENEQD